MNWCTRFPAMLLHVQKSGRIERIGAVDWCHFKIYLDISPFQKNKVSDLPQLLWKIFRPPKHASPFVTKYVNFYIILTSEDPTSFTGLKLFEVIFCLNDQGGLVCVKESTWKLLVCLISSRPSFCQFVCSFTFHKSPSDSVADEWFCNRKLTLQIACL